MAAPLVRKGLSSATRRAPSASAEGWRPGAHGAVGRRRAGPDRLRRRAGPGALRPRQADRGLLPPARGRRSRRRRRWLLSAPVTQRARRSTRRRPPRCRWRSPRQGLRGARRRRRGHRGLLRRVHRRHGGRGEPLAPARRRRRQRRPATGTGAAPARVPHLLVMLYAEAGGLEAWEQAIKGADWDQAFRVQALLPTFEMGDVEPFGFADGVSQPRLDWERTLARRQGPRRLHQPDRARRGPARLPQRVRRATPTGR